MKKTSLFRLTALLAIILQVPLFSSAATSIEDLAAGVRGQFFAELAANAEMPSAFAVEPEDEGHSCSTHSGRASNYLQPSQVDVSRFTPPPAANTAEDKADLAAVMDWQIKRTPAECARAQREAVASFESFFAGVHPFVTPLPRAVSGFFDRLVIDIEDIYRPLKQRFQRPRPYNRNPKLKPCVPSLAGYSYPSGHASISRAFALVLADFVPARKGEFLTRGDEVALDRVIAGVHHPLDIEAAKNLGDQIYAELLKQPSFTSDMQALRRFLKP